MLPPHHSEMVLKISSVNRLQCILKHSFHNAHAFSVTSKQADVFFCGVSCIVLLRYSVDWLQSGDSHLIASVNDLNSKKLINILLRFNINPSLSPPAVLFVCLVILLLLLSFHTWPCLTYPSLIGQLRDWYDDPDMQALLVFPVPLPVPPVEEVNSLTGLGSVRELKRNNI